MVKIGSVQTLKFNFPIFSFNKIRRNFSKLKFFPAPQNWNTKLHDRKLLSFSPKKKQKKFSLRCEPFSNFNCLIIFSYGLSVVIILIFSMCLLHTIDVSRTIMRAREASRKMAVAYLGWIPCVYISLLIREWWKNVYGLLSANKCHVWIVKRRINLLVFYYCCASCFHVKKKYFSPD